MTNLSVFLVSVVLVTVAPGPDIIQVLTRGVSQGRMAGLAAAAGFSTGCIFHTTLAAVGVSALIRSSDVAFTLIKLAGAFYLIYIGIGSLRNRRAALVGEPAGFDALGAIYRQSIVANILNPKVTLFFLAFLPQFVSPASATPGLQLMGLGIIFMVVTIIIFGAVAIFAGLIGDWLRRRPAVAGRLQVLAGVTFIGLGIRVALPDVR
ncbi:MULTISPECIES: LysE family translocator [Geobacter]|uniref:LysE family translocator n=1 Tax=Geobacter TaxID=28231 RepID=UPI0025732A3B|nr:LysE family translocator [Geobacter sulfurreducens]BEH10818.1 LysE family translocator [Geobacter sulfurreducens subsp. ethanolicus]BET58662.1 LysE family translocator [Geobacter sp. 60473]